MKHIALGLLASVLTLVMGLEADAQLFRRPQPLLNQNNTSNVRVIGRNNMVTVQQSNAHGGGGLASAGIQQVRTLPTHAYVNQQLLVNPAYRGSLNVVNTFTSPVNTAANIRYYRNGTQSIIVNPTQELTQAYTQAVVNPCPPTTTVAAGDTSYIIQQPVQVMQQLQQAYVQVQQPQQQIVMPASQPQQVVIQPQVQYQEVQQPQQVVTVPAPQVQYQQVQQEVQYAQQPTRVVQREVSYQTAQNVEFVQTQHAHYQCAPQNIVAQRRQFVQHCQPVHHRRRG